MHITIHSAKRIVADFLREEAPLEYERLKSIGQLATTSPGMDCDQSQLWVRDAFGRLAI